MNLQLNWVSMIAVGDGIRVQVPPAPEGRGHAAESQISPRRETGASQKNPHFISPQRPDGYHSASSDLAHFHAHACLGALGNRILFS